MAFLKYFILKISQFYVKIQPNDIKRGKTMKNTTRCYLEKDEKYLMLHRIKKVNDENRDKWIGIGGKLEPYESPFDGVRREVYEETGLTLTKVDYRGIITFCSDLYGTEYMHLFTSCNFSGELTDNCDEGQLEWVEKGEVTNLPIWEGDKIFFDLINRSSSFFSLKLVYEGDKLVSHTTEFI